MTYPIFGQAIINAIAFGVESMVYRRLQHRSHDTLNVFNSFIAGVCAGSVQTVIVCPVELIKIQLQNQNIGKKHLSWAMKNFQPSSDILLANTKLQYSYGPVELTRKILHEEGIRGMFRGWWITMLREVPQFGIYFGTYAWIRNQLAIFSNTSPKDLRMLHLSFAGGITGVVTWLWYPADVIKSRLQLSEVVNNRAIKYNGIVDCVCKSYHTEGAGVFVRGLQPTLIRGFLNGFMTLPAFTLTMHLLNNEVYA